MNINEQVETSQKAKEPFLNDQEQKDFVNWVDTKIRTGSKSYEIEGNHV